MKTYKAWARTANSNDKFCTHEVKARSLKDAKQILFESGKEIEKGTKIYKHS